MTNTKLSSEELGPDLGKHLSNWHSSFRTKYSSLWLQISVRKGFSLSATSVPFLCFSSSSLYTLPLSFNHFGLNSSAEVGHEFHLQSFGPFAHVLLLTFCVVSILRQYALPCYSGWTSAFERLRHLYFLLLTSISTPVSVPWRWWNYWKEKNIATLFSSLSFSSLVVILSDFCSSKRKLSQ